MMADDLRARLRAAGFSDPEIDAELGGASPLPTRPAVRMPSESTGTRATLKNASPTEVAANRAADSEMVKGLGANAAEGATFSLAGRVFPAVRSTAQAYAKDSPGAAMAAQMAGGVVSGFGLSKAAAKIPALVSMGLAPRAEATMSAVQRIGQGAKMGGVAGAITGGANAETAGDIFPRMVIGAGSGALLGSAFSGGAELMRGARNLVAGAGQGAKQAGPIRSLIQAESPEDAGARRVLARLGRSNMTVDDLAKAHATGDPNAAVAELFPDGQGIAGLRIARNVGRERDAIDASLTDRASEEPSRFFDALRKEGGLDAPRDPIAYAREQMNAARGVAAPKYEATQSTPVSGEDLAAVLSEIRTLQEDGINLWGKARVADAQFPRTMDVVAPMGADGTPRVAPSMTVGQLQRLRQVLDGEITYGTSREGMNSIQQAAQHRLRALRGQVDAVAKRGGGASFQEADATIAEAARRGEAFTAGQDAARAGSPDALARMQIDARDPVGFREGLLSKQMERAALVPDGGGGQVRNPVAEPFGNSVARERVRAALPTEEAFARVNETKDGIVRRLDTRRRVSSNSTTAANLSEMADEFMSDPSALIAAPLNPVGALKMLGERGARAAMQGLNAQQATAMGRILGAGLPGQMSRDEALVMLQRMEPAIRQRIMQQMASRGAATRAGLAAAYTPD